MAKISLSDTAPTGEAISFDFGPDAQFTLGGGKKNSDKFFETTDRLVLQNVVAHPWLTVEYPVVETFESVVPEQLRPEDDHLSALGTKVDFNDPEVARAAEEAKVNGPEAHVAIEAGLDQDEVVNHGPVALTTAAAEEATE